MNPIREVLCACLPWLLAAVLLGTLSPSAWADEPAEKLTPAQRQQLAEQAKALNEEAHRAGGQGQWSEASRLEAEALEIYRRLYPKETHPQGHLDLAQTLSDLAATFGDQRRFDEAEPLYHEALAMLQALYPQTTHPDGHPVLALTLYRLALLFDHQEEPSKAEQFYRDSIDTYRKLNRNNPSPNGSWSLALALSKLGNLLLLQGEYAKAEPLFREALAIRQDLFPKSRYPDGHLSVALSLTNLGKLFGDQREPAKSEPFWRQAVDMFRKLYRKTPSQELGAFLGAALNDLGLELVAQEKYSEAEPLYQESLSVLQDVFPKDKFPQGNPFLAKMFSRLGELSHRRGELAKAERYFRDSVAMSRLLFPKPQLDEGRVDLAANLLNLGLVCDGQGDSAHAKAILEEGLTVCRQEIELVTEVASEAAAFNYVARLHIFPSTRNAHLTATRRLPPDPDVYEQIWQTKAVLARSQEDRHLSLVASRDDQTRERAEQLTGVRRKLSLLLASPLNDAAEQARTLERLTTEKERLEKEIAAQLRLAGGSVRRESASAAELIRTLPDRAVFIDLLRYVYTEYDPKRPGPKGEREIPSYLAFVLRRGQEPVRVELGEAELIEEALKQWRQEIADWRSDRKTLPPSGADRRLGDLLWQPLAKHIPTDTEVVYLSPDAHLSTLPWAALPGRDKGKVLLEEHGLAVVPHGPFLLHGMQAQPLPVDAGEALVAVGAVRYDLEPAKGKDITGARGEGQRGAGSVSWPFLKATAAELDQVLAVAGKRSVVERRGSEASVSQLLEDLPRARFAHLATHGFFDDQGLRAVLKLSEGDYRRSERGERVGVAARSPLLLSGLVLAGANRKDKDKPDAFASDGGIVTGEDIVGLGLENLELAVLSACETGLGDVAAGEGVFGLQRAFHVAGCRNVVASLWQVDDEATAALMTAFYHHLWQDHQPPLQALREAQLLLYHHPERIPQLAKERGPKVDSLSKIPMTSNDTPVGENRPTGKAAVKLWAGFVLSGLGR